MTIYVLLTFTALLAGMAISVRAFGTGGKRKRMFREIYFSIEDVEGIGILYTKTGEYSAILRIENPVQKFSADIDSYYEYTRLFTALAQTLGEGYALHKQDIFTRQGSAKAMPCTSRTFSRGRASRKPTMTDTSFSAKPTSAISRAGSTRTAAPTWR